MGFTQRDYKGEEILLPNTVLGYRQWNWKNNEVVSYADSKWTNGSLTSVCNRFISLDGTRAVHSSPDMDCTCGIYAHYLPLESYERNNNIFGVVEASGRILMGTRGFRAEKAKIVALAGYGDCTQWFEPREKTRGIYPDEVVDFCTSIGVPYFPTVRQMFYEFPQEDLQSLGVPPLDDWKSSRDHDKKSYEKRYLEARKHLEKAREYEKEMFHRYGVIPSDKPGSASYRMSETMRHLGGWK